MSKKSILNRMVEEKAAFAQSVQLYEHIDSFARVEVEEESYEVFSSNEVVFSEDSSTAEQRNIVSVEDMDMTLSESSLSEVENGNSCPDLSTNVAKRGIRNKVPHSHITDLLKTLRKSGIKNLPLSARQLLKTQNHKLNLTQVSSGEYYHFGVQKSLLSKQFYFLENRNIVEIDVGIDGLSLFKSSNQVLWSIVCCISNEKNSNLFLVGCFSGKKKPNKVNEYLKELVEEIKTLKAHGIKVGKSQTLKDFKIRLFTCDAPARAFITSTSYHTSKNSCPKCLQIGRYLNHKIVFQTVEGNPKTDQNFKQRIDKTFHHPNFLQNENILETIGIEMISQFPIEPMHLIDMGVVKKILKVRSQDNMKKVAEMNKRIQSISKDMPCEFSRNVRTLDELPHWKATECRTFLLYTGIVVLKGLVSDDIYYHFLLFYSAIRTIACEKSYLLNLPAAKEMVKDFVKYFPILYGEENVSYNVYCLLHICDSVEQYGPLDNFSAYKFENYMQPLQQLYRRLGEGISSSQ